MIVLLAVIGGTTLYAELFFVDKHQERLWLHRCNSLEKLAELGERYPNFEIDVCFREDGTLDVTHDEDTTFHLSAEAYFEHLQRHPKSHMWMDIKNLDEQNQTALLSAIVGLAGSYDISPERLVVESPHPLLLAPLTGMGFQTSCYVDADKPSRLSEEQIDSVITALQGVADGHAVTAISFPSWWYSTIHERLNRPNINLLTWCHRTTQLEFFLTPECHRMLKDNQLKVILIKDKGHYHR